MKTLKWRKDPDGDKSLYVDGGYFGLVCSHRSRFITTVTIRDGNVKPVKTIAEGKAYLERQAQEIDEYARNERL